VLKKCGATTYSDGARIGWRQDNGNRSNQESKFDFLATHQCLVKIDNQISRFLPIKFLNNYLPCILQIAIRGRTGARVVPAEREN